MGFNQNGSNMSSGFLRRPSQTNFAALGHQNISGNFSSRRLPLKSERDLIQGMQLDSLQNSPGNFSTEILQLNRMMKSEPHPFQNSSERSRKRDESLD